jgi:hypothetical protein
VGFLLSAWLELSRAPRRRVMRHDEPKGIGRDRPKVFHQQPGKSNHHSVEEMQWTGALFWRVPLRQP